MATGPLGVTWSLAVEEQFYLLWPLVVRFCTEAQLRKIAIAVICLSPATAFLFVIASGQYLLEHILPFRRPDGRSTPGTCYPFGQFFPSGVIDGSMDHISCHRPARSYGRNGVPCTVDCFLFDCAGLGFFRISRSVLAAEMAAVRSDKPIYGLHRDDQLWDLFAGKDPA